jgi:hypothetical protein
MSTEHHLEALEYGPTPPGAQYEHTDINPAIGYNFAIWLGVAMILSVGIVYGTFWVFERQQVATDVATQQFPLAAGVEKEPPMPRLQAQPFKDVYLLKQTGERPDRTAADKENGVAHPHRRAMSCRCSTACRFAPASRGQRPASCRTARLGGRARL